MKPEIEKLSCAWYKAEKELFDALEKLPNYGEECNCGWENKEEPEPIQYNSSGLTENGLKYNNDVLTAVEMSGYE